MAPGSFAIHVSARGIASQPSVHAIGPTNASGVLSSAVSGASRVGAATASHSGLERSLSSLAVQGLFA